MFGLERLRALDTLARTGTVARAATELHMTPSAVSQQLAKLDREAGAALTVADGRGLRLTPAGRALAAHAKEILGRVTVARAELGRLDREVVGPLRIAGIPTSLNALAPATIARLGREHPALRITLVDGEAEQTLPALLDDGLDLAVVESWDGAPAPRPPGTSRTVLHHDVVDLVLPPDHPAAAGPPDEPVALAGLDPELAWVADTPGTRAAEWLVTALRGVNLEPRVTCRVCGFATHLELVAGAGVAALVPRLGRRPPAGGVAVRPTDPVLTRTIDAVWASHRETPAVRAGVEMLREVAAELAPEPGAAQSSSSSTAVSKQL